MNKLIWYIFSHFIICFTPGIFLNGLIIKNTAVFIYWSPSVVNTTSFMKFSVKSESDSLVFETFTESIWNNKTVSNLRWRRITFLDMHFISIIFEIYRYFIIFFLLWNRIIILNLSKIFIPLSLNIVKLYTRSKYSLIKDYAMIHIFLSNLTKWKIFVHACI